MEKRLGGRQSKDYNEKQAESCLFNAGAKTSRAGQSKESPEQGQGGGSGGGAALRGQRPVEEPVLGQWDQKREEQNKNSYESCKNVEIEQEEVGAECFYAHDVTHLTTPHAPEQYHCPSHRHEQECWGVKALPDKSTTQASALPLYNPRVLFSRCCMEAQDHCNSMQRPSIRICRSVCKCRQTQMTVAWPSVREPVDACATPALKATLPLGRNPFCLRGRIYVPASRPTSLSHVSFQVINGEEAKDVFQTPGVRNGRRGTRPQEPRLRFCVTMGSIICQAFVPCPPRVAELSDRLFKFEVSADKTSWCLSGEDCGLHDRSALVLEHTCNINKYPRGLLCTSATSLTLQEGAQNKHRPFEKICFCWHMQSVYSRFGSGRALATADGLGWHVPPPDPSALAVLSYARTLNAVRAMCTAARPASSSICLKPEAHCTSILSAVELRGARENLRIVLLTSATVVTAGIQEFKEESRCNLLSQGKASLSSPSPAKEKDTLGQPLVSQEVPQISFPELRYPGIKQFNMINARCDCYERKSHKLMNQLMDGSQGVSVGAIIPPVHRPGSSWHLLFFSLQQSHNKGIFKEARQGRQLLDLLCVHSGYTKSSSVHLWVFEVPSPEVAYAKDTRGLWAGHKGGWRLNHFPGQPVPMLDNPLGEEKFPNIQSKPPLAQLEAISSRPITCYLGEETDPHLSTTSFQAVVESNKVSPQPPFLQAKQSQLPQPLLIRLVLQTLHQLRCPSLDSLQPLNVSLVVGGPKLNTVFEVRPHQCRVQGHDHFPSPAGHAIFDTSQDAFGFLGHLGTPLAHIQLAVNQHPQVLLCQAAFQPLFPKPVALHGVAVAQVQDLALGLVEPHTIDLGPSIQPVQVPLQSLPTLKQINTPTQLGVVCKLTESTLDPFVQIIDKDVKQNWPQHRALGNTTCDRLPTGVNSIHHHSLGPAVQPGTKNDCGGQTMAGCQVPTKPLCRSPPQLHRGEKIQQQARGSR
ncbi:hypothetical protein QYF61_011010 [Mycteria americana]|uniref:Uncharacterized protein n=1 Tax=Mycteria americana TaxID=33587 RepID=A0AAN7RTP9_MYCAM|nr:hypothetical protein QYF61_011010 [Mycteria americana]